MSNVLARIQAIENIIVGYVTHDYSPEAKDEIDKAMTSLSRTEGFDKRYVVMLEYVYFLLSPFIDHNNNFAVLRGGQKWNCPECTSSKVKMFRTSTTEMGVVRCEMHCDECNQQ